MKSKEPYAHILCGLGFGDEGKGTMTDFLCRHRQADLVVRYNGGSQAAHNVVTDNGIHHTFSQVGSGAFNPGALTLLSRFMLWDPVSLACEVEVLSPKIGYNALNTHFIDCRAPVITPFHVASNRLKEWSRGAGRHGSCGKGVGETASDIVSFPDEVIRAGDLYEFEFTKRMLGRIQERKRQEVLALLEGKIIPIEMEKLLALLTQPEESGKIAETFKEMATYFNIIPESRVNQMIRSSISVFEGAQGVLLDEWHGFHPYTTWSTTTPFNALELLKEASFSSEIEVTGILRSYMTRHGAGPMVTEDNRLDNLSPKEHNRMSEWQGEFRFGAFDGVLLRYAIECAKYCTSLAVTHLDVFQGGLGVPFSDEYMSSRSADESVAEVVQGRHKVIRNLRPNFQKDLVHQEKLTTLLQGVTPVRTGTFWSVADLARYVAHNTTIPVRYVSSAPTPKGKRVLK